MSIDWTKIKKAPTPEELEAQRSEKLRDERKALRSAMVKNLTVTTASGKVFDGDEDSQNRMSRAFTALQMKPVGYKTKWILADNTVTEVTRAELLEALVLAGQAQTDLWII